MRTKVIATGALGPHARLHHGEFFGQFQREVEAGGFALAHVSADPRNDVQRHTHEAAHFIFVQRGLYVSTADGAPDVVTSPVLIYNPPGTTHRDRFRRRDDGRFDGRFLSISITPERMNGHCRAGGGAALPRIVDAVRGRVAERVRGPEPHEPRVSERAGDHAVRVPARVSFRQRCCTRARRMRSDALA